MYQDQSSRFIEFSPMILSGGIGSFAIIGFIITVIVHILLAVGVYVDATKQPVKIVWPAVWSLAVLGAGLFGVAAYWFINRFEMGKPSSIQIERIKPRKKLKLEEKAKDVKAEEIKETTTEDLVELKLKEFKARFNKPVSKNS